MPLFSEVSYNYMDINWNKYTGSLEQGDVLKARLNEVKEDMLSKGLFNQDGKDVITGYAYGEFYDWDLYFENIFLSYCGISKFCRNGVEMFLDRQHPSGFISRTIGNVYPKPRHHFKPFLAQTSLLGSKQRNDFRWLKGKYYEGLEGYFDYWFRHCDSDHNGLCFWDGSDHSGMDNQERRLGYDNVMLYEGVDLNVYLVKDLEAMSELSKALDLPEKAHLYADKASSLSKKIHQSLWYEEDSFYYDRNEKTGDFNTIKTVAGILPLLLTDLPKDRADKIVYNHLTNPNEFWIEYPIATWSKSESDYYQMRKSNECNWMGSTWIPTNYLIFHGLIQHGYMKEAKELAYKTFEMVISETSTREFYNGETGVGQGLNPFWGWSSLGYLMIYEYEEMYNPMNNMGKFHTLL